ncbi:hypothetical protein Pan216_15580 [Planctomycetes bacterium Pan216]|uniref:Uncharacterized protein n=1 Tax=Kolteria novifilia TaxID=2527975 RepID=A0A518B161_9BACT|nr:hypothetical protein Pan216_15580 [Planctomycetes bacterium Pan216]
MAWGGLIFRAPKEVSVEDLPSDFEVPPLGTKEEVSQVLRQLIPQGDHGDDRSSVVGDDFWLELNLDRREEGSTLTSIGVRSNGGLGAIGILQQICDALGARLYDNQEGDFADLGNNTRASMEAFAAFRDRAIKKMTDTSDTE